MAKTAEYSRLYRGWQDSFADCSDNCVHLWPHLLECRYSNATGLYEVVIPGLAEQARLKPAAVLAALAELEDKGHILWDPERQCVFVIHKIFHNYDSIARDNSQGRSLRAKLSGLTHLPLYPALEQAYEGLVPDLPERRGTPKARLNGAGGQEIIFTAGDENGASDTPARAVKSYRRDDRAKYLALRESVPAPVLRCYDALAPVFRAHSRQPRSDKDWKGQLADLQALNELSQKTQGALAKLPEAFRAIFAERWEDLEYCRSGLGRVQTISGLTSVWKDGTLKAVAIVDRYEAALRSRGECPFDTAQGKAELAEERNRLIAEYNALKEAGACKQELAEYAARIKGLTNV